MRCNHGPSVELKWCSERMPLNDCVSESVNLTILAFSGPNLVEAKQMESDTNTHVLY